MLNISKISGLIHNKKQCPICKSKLVESHLTEQKYTCRVACNTCNIVHDDYYFYNCYDAFISSVIVRLRAKFSKQHKQQMHR